MDETEGKEISKLIDDKGDETINFWKLMKRIKNKKQLTKKIRKDNGEITEDIEEILKEKREYYEKLYSKAEQSKAEQDDEGQKLKEIMAAMKDGSELEMNKRITTKEVEDHISRSGKNKAPGHDEITNEMLKEGKDELKEIINLLMNDIKEKKTNNVPNNWQLGDIISFYKGKGDSLDLSYQRGISLTSTILKLLESIIGTRIEQICGGIHIHSTDTHRQ